MYVVDITFLCAEDELVTVQLLSKQTRTRSKCLCTRCVCGVRDYIFVTQEGQKRLSGRPTLKVWMVLVLR